MRERNLRSRITTGSYTLPTAAIATAVLWAMVALRVDGAWGGLGLMCVTTYLLVELNNRNALLRVRSRMVSSAYLAIMATAPFFYVWTTAMLPAVALVAAYFPLFAAYQQPRAAASVFNVSLLLSLGSMAYPPLLLLVVIVFFGIVFPLRALSWRTFLALVFGVLIPYWFMAGFAIWEGHLDTAFLPFIAAFRFSPPCYATLSLPERLVALYVALLSLVAIAHYIRTAYNDKIRTRMYFDVIIFVEVAIGIAVALQPQRADVLLRLFIVNSAPLIAHHLTLARGWWANAWFLLCLIALVAIVGFNAFTFYAGLD